MLAVEGGRGVKEQEYINVADLTRIRAAAELLRAITPSISPVIETAGLQHIMIQLHQWDEALMWRIEIEGEDDDG